MRKLKRSIIRAQAKKQNAKESSFIARTWNDIQTKKYGKLGRRLNIAHGTHTKSTWGSRLINSV